MPVYVYKCELCGDVKEVYSTIEDRKIYISCNCGGKAVRVYSGIGKPVVYEYYSENLDAVVTGPRQKQRLMREKNLSEA